MLVNRIVEIKDSTKLLWENRLIKKSHIVTLLFFLSPLLSLPFVLIEIYNKKKYSLVLFAIFLGMMSWLFPPVYDLYRHYISFNPNSDLYLELNQKRADFILPYVKQIVYNANLYFEIIRFVFISSSYLIIYWIFTQIIKDNPSLKKYYFRIFIIMTAASQFFFLTTGLRFMEATILFYFGIYLILIKKNKTGIIPIIVSSCLHFSFIGFTIIFFLSTIIGKHLNNKIIIFISIFSIIFINEQFILFIVDILPLSPPLKILFRAYCIGTFGDLAVEGRNINYILANILNILFIFILIPIILKFPRNKLTDISRMGILVLSILYGFSFTFFYRYSFIYIYIGLTGYFYFNRTIFQKYILFFTLCSLLILASDLYRYRREFAIGYEYKLIEPLPFIFSTNYSSDWVEENLNDDGYLKINPQK